MTGSKYAVGVAQLEDRGALQPDAHMFFIQIQEKQPGTVTAIMTQLYLKEVFK